MVDFKLLKKELMDRYIFGVASSEALDTQNQSVSKTGLIEALTYLLKRGRISYNHSDLIIGDIIPEFKSDDGTLYKTEIKDNKLYIVGKIYGDSETAQRVMKEIDEGNLLSFSIAGVALKDPTVVCDANGCHEVIEKLEITAVTVCSKGANPDAAFKIVKMDTISKPFMGFKDFGECVSEQKKNGHSEESADKICGFLHNRAEKKDWSSVLGDLELLTKNKYLFLLSRVSDTPENILNFIEKDWCNGETEKLDSLISVVEGIIQLFEDDKPHTLNGVKAVLRACPECKKIYDKMSLGDRSGELIDKIYCNNINKINKMSVVEASAQSEILKSLEDLGKRLEKIEKKVDEGDRIGKGETKEEEDKLKGMENRNKEEEARKKAEEDNAKLYKTIEDLQKKVEDLQKSKNVTGDNIGVENKPENNKLAGKETETVYEEKNKVTTEIVKGVQIPSESVNIGGNDLQGLFKSMRAAVKAGEYGTIIRGVEKQRWREAIQ